MTEPHRFADDAHRYALLERLATGGMGEVWRARDTVLDRPVAVKLLKDEYADDALFRTRFETEARHAGSLHHHGVAAVFDFGQASPSGGSTTPRPFLVMELVEGQPLSALLRPGQPLDPDVARDLLGQAADALGAAHARGIVHRDVKPANLLVTPDRRVKVTDFGIARAAEGMALTETGQVMGTPAYLSPEQAEGGTATPASDVYSLGVVAFECLTGAKPFSADSPVATALAHLRSPVPPIPASVPADLARVVTQALSKDPAARFPDGTAFAAALRGGVPGPAGGASATVAMPPTVAGAPPSTRVLPATPAGGGAAPVPGPQTVAGPPPTGRRRDRAAWWPWALLGLAVLVAVLLLWQLADDGAEETGAPRETASATSEPTQDATPTSPTQTPTPTPSETATEEPATVEVDPDAYVGRDHKDVEKELRELGLRPTKNEIDNPGDQAEGIVASVEPNGTLEEGATVEVSYYGKAPQSNGKGNS